MICDPVALMLKAHIAKIMAVADPESLLDTTMPLRERIGSDLIGVMFRFVTPAVLFATFFAVILTLTVYYFGYLNPQIGFLWVIYIAACAGLHILLARSYKRAEVRRSRWRYWAACSIVICFAEGLGWGWASIRLATGTDFEVASLLLVSVGGVAAACIPIYCPHPPSLFALILPATVPYAFVNYGSNDKVQQALSLYLLIFVGVLICLGILANFAIKQGIRLRIRTEEMAVELRRQKEIAEGANLAKSRFLAAASHDLRQPCHALNLFVGALRSVPMHSDGERLVEQIEASAAAMDKLFAALLDISKLDAGVVEIFCKPFAIDTILSRVFSDYVDVAWAKGVVLSHVPCRAVVNSDPTLVERIVRNLVSNAVRYTDAGRIVVGCRRRGSSIVVQVWDTGRGIPPDQQEHVFQEYYQVGNPERDREKGLGLGLAIVRRLTKLLGCELALRSDFGKGSCFEVSVALSNDVASPLEESVDGNDNVSSTGFVVIIDDEQTIREGMSILLTRWGYTVVAAGSTGEVIELLSRHTVQPDLLICDFRLREGENGMEAIEKLRTEYNAHIPALLVTGDTTTGLSLGSHGREFVLLHKPIPSGKLRAAINNLLLAGSDR